MEPTRSCETRNLFSHCVKARNNFALGTLNDFKFKTGSGGRKSALGTVLPRSTILCYKGKLTYITTTVLSLGLEGLKAIPKDIPVIIFMNLLMSKFPYHFGRPKGKIIQPARYWFSVFISSGLELHAVSDVRSRWIVIQRVKDSLYLYRSLTLEAIMLTRTFLRTHRSSYTNGKVEVYPSISLAALLHP